MAGNIITLHNGSDVPQHIFDTEGKRHTMDKHQVLPFPEVIAKQFLDERNRFVSIWRPVSIPLAMPGEPIVYIANITGSPFLPETVVHKYLDRATKLEKVEHIPNPLRAPFPIARNYPRPQEVILSPGGTKTTVSHPPIPVRIPPWLRLPVPKSCADWLLRRDAQMDEKMAGALIEARAPSSWEPNETWEVHEVMVYARMVDDSAAGWVGQSDVKRAIMDGDDVKLGELKIKLLNTLFYRLVDDRWSLPTKSAFDKQLQVALEELTKSEKGASRAKTTPMVDAR